MELIFKQQGYYIAGAAGSSAGAASGAGATGSPAGSSAGGIAGAAGSCGIAVGSGLLFGSIIISPFIFKNYTCNSNAYSQLLQIVLFTVVALRA